MTSGIIIPPPSIKAVLHKTAQFVAKNGKAFEGRILNSAEGKTAKFGFMQTNNPYYAYYEERIKFFEVSLLSHVPTPSSVYLAFDHVFFFSPH